MISKQIENYEINHNYWSKKRVLITGGTAGLGKSLAVYLSDLGVQVAVIGRNLKRLETLNDEKNNIITIQGDISKKDEIHRIFGEVEGKFDGPIDILINNASSLGIVPLQDLLDTPCENFSEVLEINVLGPFRLSKLVIPSMLLNESGLILNISSDASVNAYPTWGIYSVSKAALDHLTAIWAKELPKISFLSIDPGDMYTSMQLEANPSVDEYSLYAPDDVARDLCLFLALRENNFPKVRLSASEWRMYLQC